MGREPGGAVLSIGALDFRLFCAAVAAEATLTARPPETIFQLETG